MPYKILEQNGIEIENVDGATFNNFVTGGQDCIIKGALNECKLTTPTSNTLVLNKGVLVIQGVRVKITSEETFALQSAPATDEQYQVIAQIEVNANRNVNFSIYLQLKTATLQKDNIFKTETGLYAVEVGTFTYTSAGVITDLKNTLPVVLGAISGSGGSGSSDGSGFVSQDPLYPDGEVIPVTKEADNTANVYLPIYNGENEGGTTGSGSSGGLTVKQITFTDRVSLMAWHSEQYAKGTQYISAKAVMSSQGYIVDFNQFVLSSTLFETTKYIMSNYTDRISLSFTEVMVDTSTTTIVKDRAVSISNSGVTLEADTAQTVPDTYWATLGMSVTITYIE